MALTFKWGDWKHCSPYDIKVEVCVLLKDKVIWKGVQTIWGRQESGPKIRVRNEKFLFLFLNQNICWGYSKEPSHWDGSFEHPKHMFKLMDKKKFQFYAENFCLSCPMRNSVHVTLILEWETKTFVLHVSSQILHSILGPLRWTLWCVWYFQNRTSCLGITERIQNSVNVAFDLLCMTLALEKEDLKKWVWQGNATIITDCRPTHCTMRTQNTGTHNIKQPTLLPSARWLLN